MVLELRTTKIVSCTVNFNHIDLFIIVHGYYSKVRYMYRCSLNITDLYFYTGNR